MVTVEPSALAPWPLTVAEESDRAIVVALEASTVPASSASVETSATSALAPRISAVVAPVEAAATAEGIVVQAVALEPEEDSDAAEAGEPDWEEAEPGCPPVVALEVEQPAARARAARKARGPVARRWSRVRFFMMVSYR